ncbi:PilZ domain-containing protein [Hahella ganghwensis]|uniref:PilZ domain-containing protein n=1 Tax=Hahella ganghwensis TaxID=286420 RepID=UPI000370B4E6|nr:PilZ domain-containing protein [Hahella ganghwensis]
MSEDDHNKERRRFHRIPFDTSVIIQQEWQKWTSDLIDISFKGALIGKPKNWDSAQTQAPFRIQIEIDSETHIRLTATLRHEEEDRLGFHCENMDLDSASVLRRLVELNLGDPKLLERELASLMEG